jgi:GT2 family glycosyltransferase
MNKVLICTLSFNRAPYTKRFLETFFAATKEPVDLVIVEQGSCQPARDLCKMVDGKITENGSTIKVIWNSANIGIPKALNQALALRKPEQHFMKIDNDVIFPLGYPEWLSHMVEIVENLPDKDPVKILGLSPFNHDRPRSERGNIRPIKLKNGNQYEIEFWVHPLLEMALFISRDIVNKVGNFNEKGLMYGYEGIYYQSKANCTRAYFHTYRAVHGDRMDLLESRPQKTKELDLLKGEKNGTIVLEAVSQLDGTPLNIKFRE